MKYGKTAMTGLLLLLASEALPALAGQRMDMMRNRNQTEYNEKMGRPHSDMMVTVTGIMSDRGVECPAMISDQGRLFTLTGFDLKELAPGTRIRITGVTRRASKCMQGATIQVKEVTYID